MLHVIKYRVNNNSAVILHRRQLHKAGPRFVLSVHCSLGVTYIMSLSHLFVGVLFGKGESFVLTLWRVALQKCHVLLATIYQLFT